MSRLSIRPMQPDDFERIAVQPAQASIGPDLTSATGRDLARAGIGFAAVVDGVPVVLAGVVLSMGRPAIAWAVLSEAAGGHMTGITRAIGAFLASFGHSVETGVERGFEAGARWASMLGFRPLGYPPDRWEAREDMELWRRPGWEG